VKRIITGTAALCSMCSGRCSRPDNRFCLLLAVPLW
jgi:hypothetical protein